MQQFRWLKTLGMLALACTLMIATTSCSRVPAEQAVRKQLEVLQSAIDARDAGAVHDVLADDFVGNDGLDRRGAHRLAVAMFLQHRNVGARMGPVTIKVRSDSEATARFSVLATGGNGGLLPESGQVFQVDTGWRLIDGDWKLLNASWTPRM